MIAKTLYVGQSFKHVNIQYLSNCTATLLYKTHIIIRINLVIINLFISRYSSLENNLQ